MRIFQGKYISIIGFLAGVFFIVSYFFGDQFLRHPPKKSDLSVAFGEIEWVDPLHQYRTPKKLSKLTPEVIHEQETNPANEQKIYSRV